MPTATPLQTKLNKFCLLELDYIPTLANMLGLDETISSTEHILIDLLKHYTKVLSPEVTGIVLDPVYGFKALSQKSNGVGLIFRMEKVTSDVDPLAVPQLINNWGVEDIKNNYAAAKIELYYHPNEEKALEKKQLIAEIYDYCKHESLPFILKLTIYTPAQEEFDQISFQEAQLTAIQEFRSQCDILDLQYPQDSLASATVTAEIDIPWLFNAKGVEYDIYKEMLRTALENGASGFIVSDVIWKDIENFKLKDKSPDLEKIYTYIETIVRDRLIEMKRIVKETE